MIAKVLGRCVCFLCICVRASAWQTWPVIGDSVFVLAEGFSREALRAFAFCVLRRCRAEDGHPLSELFVSYTNIDIAAPTGTWRQDGRLQDTISSRASRGVWLSRDSS